MIDDGAGNGSEHGDGGRRAGDGAREVVIREVRIPVSLSGAPAGDQWLFGRLSRPADRHPRVAQLLVSGLTYTAEYWRGHDEARYDYEAFMLEGGYATLAVDRLGIWRSSHPASGEVTFDHHVQAIEQAAAWLRGPEPFGAGHEVEQLVLVGHSYGTVTGRAVAARSPAVDGFVASAHAHRAALHAITDALAPRVRPANSDPSTRDHVPADDDGYLTFEAGARAEVFFDATYADPATLAADDAARSTGTAAEVTSIAAANDGGDGHAAAVRVPVLAAIGASDAVFCGPDATDCSSARTFFAAESAHYRQAELTVYVQQEAGHNINLHRPAGEFFAAVLAWLNHHFPVDDRAPAPIDAATGLFGGGSGGPTG